MLLNNLYIGPYSLVNKSWVDICNMKDKENKNTVKNNHPK